jgi:hypothetical protein
LALATLLNLDYRSTKIDTAGLTSRHELASLEELDEMMKGFWVTIHERLRGSIPPGIIFLPGEKVTLQGFRWAPRSWMEAHEVDHPDPLSSFNYPTRLDLKEGLHVQYPGFILHCPNRKLLLRTDFTDSKFTFPVDRGLLEWYCVELADNLEIDAEEEEGEKKKYGERKKRKSRRSYIYPIIEQPQDNPTDLAIILSRSRPREAPAEIGLLVEIYDKPERQQDDGRDEVVYCCKIIHRVRVSRVKPLYSHVWNDTTWNDNENAQRRLLGSNVHQPSILSSSSENDSNICIGEIVNEDQRWAVDGYEPKPEIPKEETGGILARAAGWVHELSNVSLLWGFKPQIPKPEDPSSSSAFTPRITPAATFSSSTSGRVVARGVRIRRTRTGLD